MTTDLHWYDIAFGAAPLALLLVAPLALIAAVLLRKVSASFLFILPLYVFLTVLLTAPVLGAFKTPIGARMRFAAAMVYTILAFFLGVGLYVTLRQGREDMFTVFEIAVAVAMMVVLLGAGIYGLILNPRPKRI